jgi:hypothetical protein
VPPFFGLNSEHRETQLEEFYFLMRTLQISYDTLRSMPVAYRAWFIRKRLQENKEAAPKDQYGLDDDTPIMRRG